MVRWLTLVCIFLAISTASACNTNSAAPNPLAAGSGVPFEVEANSDGVFMVNGDGSAALPVDEPVTLDVGEGVSVTKAGRATIRMPDLLSAELIGDGQLILEKVAADEPGEMVTLEQYGGVLLADFNPDRVRGRRLTIQTEFASVSTPGGQFLLVRNPDGFQVWIVNLGESGDIIDIDESGVTRRVSPDTARWITPAGEVIGEIPVDKKRLRSWYNSVKNGETSLTLADVLLSPANMVGTTGDLPALPRLGQPFELVPSEQGAVKLILDSVGIFGNPTYALQDCNGDGSQDIAIQAGKVRFDFRPLLARVLALDVSVVNQDQPGHGSLWAGDSAGRELGRDLLEVGPGKSQTLSLRSDQAFSTAELTMLDGCFVGFSLTPPGSTGVPGEPRAVVDPQPVDEVVNILATQEQRPSGTDELEAWPVEPGAIKIDGKLDDWDTLAGQSGPGWTEISTITYDQGCTRRFPDSERTSDLAGQVHFAFDEQSLYVAFRVDDDGYVGYPGDGNNYFLGDSPQLSLDVDLLGDFDETTRSQDDWQIDFLPEAGSPQVALWRLGPLTSRPFEEALVAVTRTDSGYLVEAALPWESFGIVPQPGDRLGVAANINDNDTPGSSTQECIISTAPRRQWDDPTTWGTLFLKPVQ